MEQEQQINISQLIDLYDKELLALIKKNFLITLEINNLRENLSSYFEMISQQQDKIDLLEKELAKYTTKDE